MRFANSALKQGGHVHGFTRRRNAYVDTDGGGVWHRLGGTGIGSICSSAAVGVATDAHNAWLVEHTLGLGISPNTLFSSTILRRLVISSGFA